MNLRSFANHDRNVAYELHSSCNLTDELISWRRRKTTRVSSCLSSRARTNFGKLLQRVEDEQRSLVIGKRGAPRAILLSIRNYVRLAAPEPEVLAIIGRESKAKGADTLNSKQINNVIRAARQNKTKRR
jgi:prevent-host-death family protein